MNNLTYYINGQFIKSKDAKIAFQDGGFQRGNAIFESIRFSNNTLYHVKKHLQRLRYALNYLEFNLEKKDEELIDLMVLTINKNSLKSGILNLMVSSNFDLNNPLNSIVNLYISIREIKSIDHEPVKVIFLNEWDFPILRFRNSIKINSYAGNIKGLVTAKKRNAFDAVFFNRYKQITEATMRNIFFIKNELIITPPLSLGILPGITRSLILELCDEHGYDYKEKIIKFDEISDMDEAFLTSSSYGIIPCYWKGWKNQNKKTKKIKKLLDNKLLTEV